MVAMNAIISASELASDLAGANPPVVLDVRWQLSVAKAAGEPPFDGRAEYAAGHLPGAVYVDLDTELASAPGERGRHPLPDLGVFGAAMRRAGVSATRPVVVYDGGQGWAAARAWWLLRWTGHPDVRVLDGGLPAWEGPLETSVPAPAEGDFTPVPGAEGLLDADGAAALARTGVLFDARAGERYRGEVEPIDRVGGHIPGAVSAPTNDNVGADGRLLPAKELAGRFKALGAYGGSQVGVYCGSGVSAAHEALALAVAGIDAALYVGSWSEWSSDPSRPVAVGPDPQ
jgi:thiosulfate/3-mercaptopyruvate sulfurtransferase